MPDRAEHLAAFHRIADLLRTAAAANARALAAYRDSPAAADVERQFEHTLDRLALFHGRGTYENIATSRIFEIAIEGEWRLAHEFATAPPGIAVATAAPAAANRAQALRDAARCGQRLRVRGPDRAVIHRGAHVRPLRPEFERVLHQTRVPYMRWRAGVVVVLTEGMIAELRAAGDEVTVLFLDADELLDLADAGDHPAFEAELERRLARALAVPDRVGDSRERHLRRRLLHQSTVFRNMRDRLAAEHPAAHAALLPILAEHRAVLESALVAAPPTRAALTDPLTASIDHERELQALVTAWAAEPDVAGLAVRFAALAGAGTHLASLERHRP